MRQYVMEPASINHPYSNSDYPENQAYLKKFCFQILLLFHLIVHHFIHHLRNDLSYDHSPKSRHDNTEDQTDNGADQSCRSHTVFALSITHNCTYKSGNSQNQSRNTITAAGADCKNTADKSGNLETICRIIRRGTWRNLIGNICRIILIIAVLTILVLIVLIILTVLPAILIIRGVLAVLPILIVLAVLTILTIIDQDYCCTDYSRP